jgi:hypothetical protein
MLLMYDFVTLFHGLRNQTPPTKSATPPPSAKAKYSHWGNNHQPTDADISTTAASSRKRFPNQIPRIA